MMRILIVEDDYFAAEAICDEIFSLGDTVLGPVANAGDAFAYIGHTDAAILDVRLGEKNSFSIADTLKAKDLPFLFLTGFITDGMPLRFRTEAIRSKPCQTRSLLVDSYRMRLCRASSSSIPAVLVDMLAYSHLRLEDRSSAERLVEAVMLKAIAVVENGTIVSDMQTLLIKLLDLEIDDNLLRHFN